MTLARLVLFGLITGPVASPALAFDPGQALPGDPAVRISTLENGVTVYVRENPKPEARAELRLVVDAGSVLEDEDQRGLAHFLEHMAFNGTRSFAANELVDYLESIGMRFGPDLNAYTSFEETVYMLQVPTDDDAILETGIQILSEWATGMTLDSGEIDKERGVVLEEWRLGQGAQERLRQVHWPVLFRGSRHAERMPIGTPEVLRSFTPRRLRDFYETWYRPELMAVIAVGDFNAGEVEIIIQEAFGSIPSSASPVERPRYPIPLHRERLASVATDPEMPYTQISINVKHPTEGPSQTLGDYYQEFLDLLVSSMLTARLDELREKPDAPFLFAGAGTSLFLRSMGTFQAYAVAADGQAEPAFRALLTEVARIRIHGFTEGELDRAKARLRSSLERAYNERDKIESGRLVSQLVSHFLREGAFTTPEFDLEIAGPFFEAADLDAVRKRLGILVQDENTVILASGPEKEGAALPTPDDLLRGAAEATTLAPEPYVDGVAGTSLLETLPEPGSVVKRKEHRDLGVTALTLSNGVEVWLKPTDFKNDEILFGARVRGGKSLIEPGDYPSADFAVSLVNESGYGGYTPTDLSKLLAGKIVSVSPVYSDFVQGFSGSCTPRDLETALQALYLMATGPNDRPEAYEVLRERIRGLVANRMASPETRVGDAITSLNTQDHYMYQPLTLEYLDRFDRNRAQDIYRSAFSDFGGYRFYFVGSFDPAGIEPLLATYLGSLPADGGTRKFRDAKLRFPSGTTVKTVRAGSEPKSGATFTWPARTGLDEMKMFYLRKANDILEIRLRDLLREELGGTYGVSVGHSALLPYAKYETTRIAFGCAPESVDRLRDVVMEEVRRFKAGGPSEDEVAKIQELERRGLEEASQRNGYWLGSFLTVDQLGWNPRRILERGERIESMTPDRLRKAFSRNYPDDRYTVVVRLPESDEPDTPQE